MDPMTLPSEPEILTTTVGSYSPIDWLIAWPTEQALIDATSAVIHTQKRAGIDLPTDGELYRFDPNHAETNGMIDYFVARMGGVRREVGRTDNRAFSAKSETGFRRKPAGVVEGEISEGTLDLPGACARSSSVADGPLKFTLTSPFMLARMLLDLRYGDVERLTMAIAGVLADQARDLRCACVQVDEANVPGSPEHGPIAQGGINLVLDAIEGEIARPQDSELGLLLPTSEGRLFISRGGMIHPTGLEAAGAIWAACVTPKGTIIAVGDGRILDNGQRGKLQVKAGDRVIFTSYAGDQFKVDDEEYLLMREDEILAVIED